MNFKCKEKISISIIFVWAFTLSTSIVCGQNTVRVIDEKSNVYLPAVSVSLNTTKAATSTNEEGEFDLKSLFPINENDTLYFSHISYVNKSITLSELKEKSYVVSLLRKDQALAQVTITSERLTPNSLIQYKELSPMPDGVGSLGSVLVDDKIYVIGGDNSTQNDSKSFTEGNTGIVKDIFSEYENYSGKLQIYDIQENKWKTSNLKFRKRAYHNVTYYNGKIYILGGKRYSTNHRHEYLDNTIEVYDIKKDSILVDNTNPHQAVNSASFVYKDNMIVLGGSTKIHPNGKKDFTRKVHLLNLRTGYWYEMDDLPTNHDKETKGVIIDNIIYLVGDFLKSPLKYISTYDLLTGECKMEQELLSGLERPAMAYNDTIIYIFENNIIQTYNTKDKELREYAIDLPLTKSEMFYKDEVLYIIGGSYVDEYSTKPSNHLYCIDLSEFDRVKDYKIP